MAWLFLLVRGGAPWRWLAVVGGAFAAILALKLLFGIAPSLGHLLDIQSPSGHTATVAAAYGGLAVLILGARAGLAVSVATAALIGWSRIALEYHSVPEVILGGAVGVAATLLLPGHTPRLSGPNAALLAALTALLLSLDHGHRAQIEPTLRHVEAALRL